MGGRDKRNARPSPKCGADFGTHISRQSDLYRRLIRELNIKSEQRRRENRPRGRISPRLTQEV